MNDNVRKVLTVLILMSLMVAIFALNWPSSCTEVCAPNAVKSSTPWTCECAEERK